MDKKEIARIIDKEIEKTRSLIETYIDMTRPVTPDVAIGRISRMDEINNKSIAEVALRQAEDKLRKLAYVKARMDTPEFGLCKKCKNPIPIGRILIMPESLYCVRCAG